MPKVSKKPLSVGMKKKTLNLHEKVKLTDFANKNLTFGCWKEFGKLEGKSRESAYFFENSVYWNLIEWINVSVNFLYCELANNAASYRAFV